jgi:uncharacterized coiled-coil DUF342 family protein
VENETYELEKEVDQIKTHLQDIMIDLQSEFDEVRKENDILKDWIEKVQLRVKVLETLREQDKVLKDKI